MSERIFGALDRHFAKHRIVFWYDPGMLMRQIYEGFHRAGIKKIELANDELKVKFRMLKEEPDSKFLVYSSTERPAEAQDWLLDLSLEHFVFSTDEAAMYVQDLGLSDSLRRVVADRIDFFRDARERLEPLSALAKPEWVEEELLYAMLSIASSSTKAERQALKSIDEILISLCADKDSIDRWNRVVDWKLDNLFFERVRREYGISLETPKLQIIPRRSFSNVTLEEKGTFLQNPFPPHI